MTGLFRICKATFVWQKIIDKPARSYLQKLMRRLKILCEMQVVEAIVEFVAKHGSITAQHDATGNRGKHIQGFRLQLHPRTV